MSFTDHVEKITPLLLRDVYILFGGIPILILLDIRFGTALTSIPNFTLLNNSALYFVLLVCAYLAGRLSLLIGEWLSLLLLTLLWIPVAIVWAIISARFKLPLPKKPDFHEEHFLLILKDFPHLQAWKDRIGHAAMFRSFVIVYAMILAFVSHYHFLFGALATLTILYDFLIVWISSSSAKKISEIVQQKAT